MWLDRTLEPNSNSQNSGHVGDLWMVHGGGFYHVEKLLMGATHVPDHLHWFKWESYWTWLSGLFLMFMVFYAGSGTFLLDSSVSQLSYWQALGLSLFSILASWIFYDFLWERDFVKTKPYIAHTFTLIWFALMSYLLCHTISGRAAYMHIGAMLGTWMTANVFLRIIPRQVKMVAAAKKNEPINQEWAKNAKNRSTHNTYFTLPVIFIMMSNHFPSTYGSKYNWLILLFISASGAAIREYFILRLKKSMRAITFLLIGIGILSGVIIATSIEVHEQLSSTPVEIKSPMNSAAPLMGSGHRLRGVVRFEGEVPKREKLLLPLSCAKNNQTEVNANDILVSNGLVQNVFVQITNGLENKAFADIPPEPVVLDQRNCQYEPRVVGVRVGQKVEFINSDPVFHNVRALSQNNPEFNVAMPNQNDRITQVFYKPEMLLQTKCSVHPWMSAWIGVVDHPYFKVTNENGEFEILGLPPGRYTLEAWHEVFGKLSKQIEISDESSAPIEFIYSKKK